MRTCYYHNELPYIFIRRDTSDPNGFSYEIRSHCSFCSKELPVTPETHVILNDRLTNRQFILFKSDWFWVTSRDVHDMLDDICLNIDTSGWSSLKIFVTKYLKYMQEYYPDVVASVII